MIEEVKHPNAVVVLSVNGFGKTSNNLLTQLDSIVSCTSTWGGRVLLKMPETSKEWNNPSLAKLMTKYEVKLVPSAIPGDKCVYQ